MKPAFVLLGLSVIACPVCPVWAEENFDDVLGGFDDTSVEELVDSSATDEKKKQLLGWDYSGSLSAAASYNLRDHRSSTGTSYSGFSKLRLRSNIGLDRDLGDRWRASFNAYGWYDAVYELRNSDYSDQVIDEHRDDLDIQDAYLEGKLTDNTDMRIGRQVVVWGYSDNLRVLDFLNPLDNLEPGLADIEDLRRPTGMLKLDHYIQTQNSPWQLSLIAIPEQRFSRNPAFGSDFYAITDNQGNAVEFREEQPNDFEDLNTAASLKGQALGLDISLVAARHFQDRPYLNVSNINPATFPAGLATFNNDVFLAHSRINSFGWGIQKAIGSWLVKQEARVLLDTDLTETQLINVPGFGPTALPLNNIERDQFHALLGLEYFGIASTNISLDVAFRYIDDFTDGLERSGLNRLSNETALRVTRDFMNERLRANLIVILFDDSGALLSGDGGAIYRINASYELAEALELSGGLIFYESGYQPLFSVSGKNDRAFAELKWSF